MKAILFLSSLLLLSLSIYLSGGDKYRYAREMEEMMVGHNERQIYQLEKRVLSYQKHLEEEFA